jgi:cysteine desulfurase
LLSLSAHKFHGPKSTGALFVRDPDLLAPLLYGGGQQQGLRAGTENPASVVGMVAALTDVVDKASRLADLVTLRNEIESRMIRMYDGAFVLGALAERLPNTVNICLPGMDAEDLVDRMAVAEIAISAGSACSYGARKPSYVALAHGLNYDDAKSCIRISFSVESTLEEVEAFLRVFSEIMAVEGKQAVRGLETS